MAITATDTSIGPNTLGVGNPVYYSTIQTAQEFANYAFQETTTTYFSFSTDEAIVSGFGDEDLFLVALTPIATGQIWIDPDVQGILVAARFAALAAGDPRVRFVIGGATADLDVVGPSAAQEVSSTLTSGSIGATGWVNFTISTRYLTTPVTVPTLMHLRAQSARVTAANIPAPVNE